MTEVFLTDTDSEIICQEGTPKLLPECAREQLVSSPNKTNVAENQNDSGGSVSLINPIIHRQSDLGEINLEQSVLLDISNIMCDSLNMIIYKGNSHNSSNSTVLVLSRNGSDDNLCINTYDEPIHYNAPVENTMAMHKQEDSPPVLISVIRSQSDNCVAGALSLQATSTNAFTVSELREIYVPSEQNVYTNLDRITQKDVTPFISGKNDRTSDLVNLGENIFFPQTPLEN